MKPIPPHYLVVDPGLLGRPHLDEYREVADHLSKGDMNFVVFSDFALGEAFNGANIKGLCRTFALFRNRMQQLIVLRDTPLISRMPPEETELSMLVSELESNRLRALLHRAFTGTSGVELEITERSQHESRRFETLLLAAPEIRADLMHVLSVISDDERKELRNDRVSEKGSKQVAGLVRDFTKDLMIHHAGWTVIPPPNQIIRTFIYRLALALVLQGLRWKATGGLESRSEEQLRNDTTDATYVAYGSLFGKLVTADGDSKKLFATVSSIGDPL